MDMFWLCDSVTLGHCDSVDNKGSNIAAALNAIGPQQILHQFSQKQIFPQKILGQGPVGLGAKKTLICQEISANLQGIGLKIET